MYKNKLINLSVLGALFALTLSCMLFSASVNADDRPNVIWLVLEDISLDLNVYGEQKVHTPNLDRLANEGIRYNQAFATAAVCSTARSAFFTGMHATSIGAHHHRSHLNDGFELPEGVKMLSYYLRNVGYYNLLMGPKQKTDFNFNHKEAAFDAMDGELKYSGGAYTHAPLSLKVLDKPAWKKYKKEGKGRPFFAQINYSETHRTFIADPSHPVDPATVNIPSYYPDHDITRRDWALYLETVQYVDKKVGNLFKELEAEGVLDNTIVFIFGDHGRAMLRDKQWLYDGGMEVPLIVWGKGIKGGQVSNELVSLIDLAPTTLDLIGAPVPKHMEGHVFLGKNKKPRHYVYAHKDRCDETDDRVRAVRDQRFKYIKNFWPHLPYTTPNQYKKFQYPVFTLMQVLHKQGKLTPEQELFMASSRPSEELYDTINDPDEVHNLAKKPNYADVLKRMRKELDDWQRRTGDQGMKPESDEEIAYWDDFMKKHFEKNMKARGLSPDISPEDYLVWWDQRLKELGK